MAAATAAYFVSQVAQTHWQAWLNRSELLAGCANSILVDAVPVSSQLEASHVDESARTILDTRDYTGLADACN